MSETYFNDDLDRWPCHQFWKRVTVNHDGDVRFCVEDWRNTGLVGNVMDMTIAEMWKSPLYEELRERQRLMLDILRLARRLGVEFAFPTQTIQLQRQGPGMTETPVAEAGEIERLMGEARDESGDIVRRVGNTD